MQILKGDNRPGPPAALNFPHTPRKYSEIPLLRPPKIKTSWLLLTLFVQLYLFFSSFSTSSVPLIRDHLWDCQKWSLRPLLDSPKGGLNIGILLYIFNHEARKYLSATGIYQNNANYSSF